jgi:hypothetical protein
MTQNQGESGVDCGGPCAACPEPKSNFLAILPFIVGLAIIGGLAVAVLLGKSGVSGGSKRVLVLLDTADGMLLEGRDDEAADWFREATKAYEGLTDKQRKSVEGRYNAIKRAVEGQQRPGSET